MYDLILKVSIQKFYSLALQCVLVLKTESKLSFAKFLPSLIMYAMVFGAVESIDTFKKYTSLIAKLIETTEEKLDVIYSI